jgi:hypothetical protein
MEEEKQQDGCRAFDPRHSQDRAERRLRWAQVITSVIDAIARLADVASHLIR